MKVTYCIPVLNRFDDLKATLRHNISIVSNYIGDVELLIHCFDEDDDVVNWINENFKTEIIRGILRFKKMPTLKHWHFCWAKNSFRSDDLGDYYSSLDGDNYLSVKEVDALLLLISRGGDFLVHHFSGQWGDGTSGRVSLPSLIYKDIGYDEKLFPRQFDEISLMMASLSLNQSLRFVSNPGVYIENMSNFFNEFLMKNKLKLNRVEVDMNGDVNPLMPRGEGYVEKDPKLNYYQDINGYYTMAKFSVLDDAKRHFETQLKKKQDVYLNRDVQAIPINVMFDGFLNGLKKSADLTVYAVIKNDHIFLDSWYKHYVSLGVKRFIVVDDGSTPAVSFNYPNVFVFRPLIGEFKYFKTYWLHFLMNNFQETGSWVLTIDSDEFFDLVNERYKNFNELFSKLPQGAAYIPGLMIDMAPEKNLIYNKFDFLKEFSYYLFRPENDSFNYKDQPSIKWAFGKYWYKSYAIDIRFRYFGTIDCLRKFAVFRFQKGLTLNQGFHDLKFNGNSPSHEDFFSGFAPVFPIRHYKLIKFFDASMKNAEVQKNTSGYFERTRVNLEKIGKFLDVFMGSAWPYSPYKQKYVAATVFDFLNRKI